MLRPAWQDEVGPKPPSAAIGPHNENGPLERGP